MYVSRRSMCAIALVAVTVLGSGLSTGAAQGEDQAGAYVHVHADGVVHRHAAPAALPPDDPERGLIYRGLEKATDGPCAGLYRVKNVKGTVMCTHGPDPAPPGLSVHGDVPPAPRTADPAAQPLVVCAGDGVSGRRVEVLYVHGSVDRYAQFVGTFRALAEGVDTIFNESARQTGGERHVRFVTEAAGGTCQPTVRNVTISDSALGSNDWAPVLNAVRAQGYTSTDRKYLMFVDTQVFCGLGGFAGDDRKADDNRSNFGPEYARVDSGCWAAGVAAHEVGHTLGAVNNSAPNASGGAHCTDEWDVMCYSDSPNFPTMRFLCTDRLNDNRLDCNHDDYYHTNPSPGSYLATHWNVADSLFLIPGGNLSPETTGGGTPPK
jgi:hypothetical protein